MNVFDVLRENNINYDTYMHTYHINGFYWNRWSGEKCQYDNNQHKILDPTHLIIDNQDQILRTFNMHQYYTKLGNWTGMSPDLTKYLIRNMVLALYSKKKITELVEKNADKYDYVIIMRPDMKILNKLDINYFDLLNDENIIIPEKESHSGCNDRLCISKVKNAMYYGKLYDRLLEYSRIKSIASERYLCDMLTTQNIEIIKKDIDYEIVRAK